MGEETKKRIFYLNTKSIEILIDYMEVNPIKKINCLSGNYNSDNIKLSDIYTWDNCKKSYNNKFEAGLIFIFSRIRQLLK